MTMKKTTGRILSVLLASAFLLPFLPALPLPGNAENGKRRTPIMGWASWNAYRTDISEEIILSQARKLKELGLADLGYTFVNVDDGWQYGRGGDGYVVTHPEKFPSGMKALADAVHALGLRAGIYTDAGALTCGWCSDNQTKNDNVGLYGHDESDLRRYFIDWGYDFIKVDWCGGVRAGLSAKTRYTEIGAQIEKIEREIGRDLVYNVCCWSFPGEWVVNVADSWRTGGDITNNFESVINQIDNIKSLAKYCGPGHVNDLDMMQIGNGMTYEEDKSHFAMWCMMSTPLMLGMDLNAVSDETLSIVSNAELIALDQDPACLQARVAGIYGQVEAWVKDLGQADSDVKAFAFLNRGNTEATFEVDFEELGLADVISVRDLWGHTDISCAGKLTVTVPAHGTAVYKCSGRHVKSSRALFTLPEKDDGSVLTEKPTFDVENKPARVNLTKIGADDWIHTGKSVTRMKNGMGELSYGCEGSFCTYDNAAAAYSWTNGEDPARQTGDKSGIGVLGDEAYIYVSCPCDMNKRTLTAAFGSYSANMEIELIVGGKSISKKTVKGGANVKADRLVTATFSSDRPTTAYLVARVTRALGSSQSVNLEGAGLRIEPTVSVMDQPALTRSSGQPALSVPLVCSEENAYLMAAFRGENGELLRIATKNLKKGAQNCLFDRTVIKDHTGSVDLYLWRGQTPLCPYKTFEIASRDSLGGIGMMEAKYAVSNGAALVDVRSEGEYEAGHLEGAVHLDYLDVRTKAGEIFPDKDAAIIVYCASAKRSAQAYETLRSLGYTNVRNLGSMSNYSQTPTLSFDGASCRLITSGERIGVNYTCGAFDEPEVYISAGASSTFKDAVPAKDFTVPSCDGCYLTLKAYLSYKGVCYAQKEERFLYWSDDVICAYASDLPWTEATVGWGSIKKDRSVEGNALRLAGKTFRKGIGTHATSVITMNIPEGSQKFVSAAGCDEETSKGYTMIFYVKIDGETVAQSSLIKGGQHFLFDIDIPSGAKTITLYAFEGTYGGNTCDHADWCVAGFYDRIAEN